MTPSPGDADGRDGADRPSATLAAASPGRVRVKLDRRQDAGLLDELARAIAGIDGVDGVRANPAARSIAVEHDPAVLDTDTLIDAMRRVARLDVHRQPAAPAHPDRWRVRANATSALGDELAERFVSLDRRILAATDGGADLRVLVPLALAVLAGRRAVRRLDAVPWYQYAWWAFDSFLKLHRPIDRP